MELSKGVPPKSGESVREEPCSPVVSDSVDVRSPVTCIPTLTDTTDVHFVTNSGEAIGKICYLNTSGKLVHSSRPQARRSFTGVIFLSMVRI